MGLGTQMRGEGEKKERKRRESKRLNLMIFLKCAFSVVLSIYVGVLTSKQTVKLFPKTVFYSSIHGSMCNEINTIIYFQAYFFIHGL